MQLKTHPTQFGLIRHLPTEWNQEKRIQGQMDSALASESERLGNEWGRMLSSQTWDRILSSDLGRAQKTAELVNTALNIPIMHSPLLQEMDWGEWTGRSLRQIKAENPGLLSEMEKTGWTFRPPGGEDRIEVWERAYSALKDTAEKYPGQTILVVTHEGVIKCLIYRLSRRRFLPDEPPLLKPGYLHRFVYASNELKIEAVNAMALAG
jgi:probable phosphoglycerate mutase